MSRLANPNEERENTGGAAASSDDNDNGAPRERRGGLGRDKASRRFENATAEEREAANSDGRFGYYDMVNKRYVPAFFDAIDGGGRDTRGDEFRGGPLSDLLNKIMHPYGTLRERAFVAPNTSSAIQAAVQGGGSGGGNGFASGASRPILRPSTPMTEAQKEQVVMNQPVVGVDPRNFARGTEPTMLNRFQQAALAASPAAPMQDFAMGAGRGPIDDGAEGAIGLPPAPLPDFTINRGAPAIDDGAEGSMLTRGDMVYSGRSNTGMPDRPELQYSGRGTSVGGFSPALYASMVDDLNKMGMSDFVDTADSQAMMDLYSTYVQNGGALY